MWVRACRPEERQRLLRVVANRTKNDKFEDQQYVHAWEKAYTDVLDHYIEKVKFYTVAWLETDAGKRFSEVFNTAKSKGKKLPSLTFDAFHQFEDANGMDWGLPEMANFYSILGEYSDASQVERKATTRLLRPIRG